MQLRHSQKAELEKVSQEKDALLIEETKATQSGRELF